MVTPQLFSLNKRENYFVEAAGLRKIYMIQVAFPELRGHCATFNKEKSIDTRGK